MFLTHIWPDRTSGLGPRFRSFLKALSQDWAGTLVERGLETDLDRTLDEIRGCCIEILAISPASYNDFIQKGDLDVESINVNARIDGINIKRKCSC